MADTIERKKLIEYLPPFMQQFPEMQEIMKTQNLETDRINKNMLAILDNAFIEDCNEYGIKKYESILGIVPIAEDTLESRKIRVLNRWNDTLPYTYRVLLRRLNIFCGVNNYDIGGNLENYELFIKTDIPEKGQVEELEVLLDGMIPENIYMDAANEMKRKLISLQYMAGTVTSTRIRTIGKAV